ncbi:hypothetical protein DV096_03460 [Bradymonadaceae bacterium TMQ3]|nr:hypothetical protein DV096_03460 [Bradymonadaceae bacterium TMQ3]
MAEKPEHDAWRDIANIFKLAAELPATTFDALDCLTMVPKACATAFLKAGVNRIERWWSELEELPFSWHLISIADWRIAVTAVRTEVTAQAAELDMEIPADSYLGHVVQHMRKQLGGDSPLFAFLDEQLELGMELPAEELRFARTSDQMLEQMLLRPEFNELLGRRDPDYYRWPDWTVPKQVRRQPLFEKLCVHQPEKWRRAVADAPVVAALACSLGIHLERPDVIYLRRLRNFDRHWFDFAYRVTLARIIAKTPDDVLLGTAPQKNSVSHC